VSVDGFPAGADGDVLRRLQENGFDFSRPHDIDFAIDFDAWPPADDAIAWLKQHYQSVAIYDPEDGDPGDVIVQVHGLVTHDLVVQTQAAISSAMSAFGGICEAWGMLDDGP
jgi:hypothetical protein